MTKRVYMKAKGPYRVVNVLRGGGNKTGVVCKEGELGRGENGVDGNRALYCRCERTREIS